MKSSNMSSYKVFVTRNFHYSKVAAITSKVHAFDVLVHNIWHF